MGWISVLSRHHILSPTQLSKKSEAMDGTEYLMEGPCCRQRLKHCNSLPSGLLNRPGHFKQTEPKGKEAVRGHRAYKTQDSLSMERSEIVLASSCAEALNRTTIRKKNKNTYHFMYHKCHVSNFSQLLVT